MPANRKSKKYSPGQKGEEEGTLNRSVTRKRAASFRSCAKQSGKKKGGREPQKRGKGKRLSFANTEDIAFHKIETESA